MDFLWVAMGIRVDGNVVDGGMVVVLFFFCFLYRIGVEVESKEV